MIGARNLRALSVQDHRRRQSRAALEPGAAPAIVELMAMVGLRWTATGWEKTGETCQEDDTNNTLDLTKDAEYFKNSVRRYVLNGRSLA